MNGPNDRNPHQKKNKEKADEYLGSRRYGGGSVDAQNHHYYLNQSFYGGMWSPLSVKGPSPLQYPQQPEFELSQIRHWRDGDKEKNYSQDQNRRKSSPNEFFAGVAPNELSPPMTMKKANSCSLRDKAENVAKVEYEKLLSKRKGVTLWKVLEASLLVLKAESLESLGLRLHNVPTLRKILLLEGKVLITIFPLSSYNCNYIKNLRILLRIFIFLSLRWYGLFFTVMIIEGNSIVLNLRIYQT